MKKLTALGASTIGFLTITLPAFAMDATPIPVNPCPENTTGTTQFSSLCNLTLNGGVISRGITIALVVAALIALAFLIFGGVRWILSGGEKEKVEEARGTIIAALVGLVLVFAAYFIINIVFGLFGLGNINGIKSIPLLNVFGTPTPA